MGTNTVSLHSASDSSFPKAIQYNLNMTRV